MGHYGGVRPVPDWGATLESVKECIEGVLMGIDMGMRERTRPDVLTLEALDELDGFLNSLKRDLGV